MLYCLYGRCSSLKECCYGFEKTCTINILQVCAKIKRFLDDWFWITGGRVVASTLVHVLDEKSKSHKKAVKLRSRD